MTGSCFDMRHMCISNTNYSEPLHVYWVDQIDIRSHETYVYVHANRETD